MDPLSVRCEVMASDDLDEARSLLGRDWPGAMVLPGEGGRFHIALRTDFLGGMATHQLSTRSGATFRFQEQFDGYMLVLFGKGALSYQSAGRWHEHAGDHSLMIDASHVERWRWQPGCYEMVLVPADRVSQRLSLMLEQPVVRRLKFRECLVPDAFGVRLSREIARVARMFSEEHPAGGVVEDSLTCLQDALVAAVLTRMPHSYSDQLVRAHASPSPRHVRQAVEFIEENARSAITIEDIARAVHVSTRTLQSGFSKYKDMSPTGYLKRVRLEGVRRELGEGGDNAPIAEIARRWQFGHLGLFARDYRKAFGELPSATRRALGKRKG